jgi:hypothetical protein
MRHIILPLIFLAGLGLPSFATAQISPFVTAQAEAAVTPCSNAAGKISGLPDADAKTMAQVALPLCYEALNKLDTFEIQNLAGLTVIERSYLYYMGGNTIWLTAGAETLRNNGIITSKICTQVNAAQKAWSNVRVNPDSEIDVLMRTNDLKNILVPACQALP